MIFNRGIKLNRRRPIRRGHKRGHTEAIIKQGNRLGVRLQEREGNATRYLVGKSPKNIGRKRPCNFNILQSCCCSIGGGWQTKTGTPSVRHTKKEGAERTGQYAD